MPTTVHFGLQQYLPDELVGKVYYKAKDTGSYERAIKEFMDKLKKEK